MRGIQGTCRWGRGKLIHRANKVWPNYTWVFCEALTLGWDFEPESKRGVTCKKCLKKEAKG
jgi:hypothetical protein